MTNKLNDLIAVGTVAFKVVAIKREGLDMFAILKIEGNSQVELCTFFDSRFAFTRLHREIYKASKEVKIENITVLIKNDSVIFIED